MAKPTFEQVQRFQDGETAEECAKRLVEEGFTLENTGELAAFLAQYPEEVENLRGWLLALGEASRWAHPVGNVLVPCVHVYRASQFFDLNVFRCMFRSENGVLVSRK